MTQDTKFSNTFIESLVNLQESDRLRYLALIFTMPEKIRSILFTAETASYIRGFLKAHDIPLNYTETLSISIICILTGEKTLAQLPAILSTELKLPNDKAQKMAAEIEKDVFGPVKKELDEFNKTRITTPRKVPPTGETTGLRNVLNLKELPARRPQAQLPTRPAQKDFPVRIAGIKPAS